MEKKAIDWSNLGFSYMETEKRFVSNYKDGKWDAGLLTDNANVVINECAGVLQYAQTCFEGLKAYTTEDGHIVMIPPGSECKENGGFSKETYDAGIPGRAFFRGGTQSGRGE